jgi:hypothetical protein
MQRWYGCDLDMIEITENPEVMEIRKSLEKRMFK